MSAYIIENEGINNLINSFYCLNDNEFMVRKLKEGFKIDLIDGNLDKNLERFGQLLINLNQKSINQRYKEKGKPFKFELSDKPPLKIHQFLKSVEHYLYQSCEGNCDKTKLYKFLLDLRDYLRYKIVSNLPEYKATKWE